MNMVTSKVSHETVGTDEHTIINFEEVNATTLEIYKPVIQDIIDGKHVPLSVDKTCYVLGRTVEDTLIVDLYHIDYDFCLISMTIYPPKSDDISARSVADMSGIKKLQNMSGEVLTDNIRNTLIFLGDIGRVLAWTWLIHKGYVKTGV